MHKISFYLIEKTPQRQVELACRLCQQIYKKHHIWVYFSNQTDCEAFDLLLWQENSDVFIPHGIDQYHAQICLSQQTVNSTFDVCINLSGTALNVTELPHSALHIIEIVGNNEQDKQLARDSFKFYRKFGIEPKIHKV